MKYSPELTNAFSQINKLTSKSATREGRYVRNISRYMFNGNRRVDLWNPDMGAQWFVRPARGGTDGVQTTINVIKSCTDTIVSKMSQATVRPVFNTVGGDYDSRQVAKTLQHLFDVYFDEQHADPKLTRCFRDACVFDYGVMFLNPDTRTMERVAPWKYFIDPAEYEANAVTEVVKWEKYFPLAKYKDKLDNKSLKQRLDDNHQLQGKLVEYWDLYGGYKWEFFDNEPLHDPEKLEYEIYDGLYRRPFVEIWYRQPMKGFSSQSLADDLYEIQRNIDSLMARIDQATRNAILSMGFIPEGTGLKPSMIENGWKLYQVPADAQEPKFINPPVIDPQFISELKRNIDLAYEMSGVSQLSATSLKPADVISGKAFQTLQDIESDRFNTQLQQYSHFKIDCARVAIDCFPKGESILENKQVYEGDDLKWGDARAQRKLYTLQFAPADMLSKDPSEKFEQIKILNGMGVIESGDVADFLQIPDFEGAETIAMASKNHVHRIINNAVKNEEYEYDESVDLNSLFNETIKQLNAMNAAGDNPKYIDRCKELLLKVNTQQQTLKDYMQPPPPTPPFEPLRDYSLDSGQIQALSLLIKDVTANAIPFANALALATAACPKIPQMLLSQMLKPQAQVDQERAEATQQPAPQQAGSSNTNLQGATNGTQPAASQPAG